MSKNKLDLNKVKRDFDFHTFLTSTENYSFSSKDSKKDGTYSIYKQKSEGQTINTILLQKKENGHWVYNQLEDSTNKGSIIDYLMLNRSMDWNSCMKFLSDSNSFLTNREPIKVVLRSSNDKNADAFKLIDKKEFLANEYFNKRGIQDIILKEEFIKKSLAFIRFENKKGISFYSNASILRDSSGEIKSYNVKSDFFKRGQFTSTRNNAAWYAKPKQFNHLVIGESFIDSISYFKMNPLQGTMLFSTEGRFSENYVNPLLELSQTQSIVKYTLANDNDINGYSYDMNWVARINKLAITAGVKDKKVLVLTISDETILIRLKEIFPNAINQDNKLLFSTDISFVVPKIIKTMKFDNIRVKKSVGKDWNDDLLEKIKQSEMKKIKIRVS